MPKARIRKDTAFENKPVKSVFLYGVPNKEKRELLCRMQEKFCEMVNGNIRTLNGREDLILQLIKNDQKDSDMRKLEKSARPEGINSAFCQAAFDMAVVHMSNRLNSIRLDMYAQEQTIFTKSKVLFAMSILGKTKEEMAGAMTEIADGKDGFYADCTKTLESMKQEDFQFFMIRFMDSYRMACMEYKIPEIDRADIPLDSRLMKVEKSDHIEAPYVIRVTDPFHKNQRFTVPLETSRHSLNKIRSSHMAGTVNASMQGNQLRIAWAYSKTLKQPKTCNVIGLDTGIVDLFHSSDGKIYSSMKAAINFYKDVVEPSFAEISNLRNKKKKILSYLHKHPGLTEDTRRSLIAKADRLEKMIQEMDAPYRKKRHYCMLLDKAIKDGVEGYMEGLGKDTLTAIERLDIKEFNKSRKVNGMFSTFARGKAQQTLMAALNWKGYDFIEVAPEYTSQVCPVCSNLDQHNRNGKVFRCTCCGYTEDADYVGGINIRERALDQELIDICEKYRYSHKGLTEALKNFYGSRHDNYKKQHPVSESVDAVASVAADAA